MYAQPSCPRHFALLILYLALAVACRDVDVRNVKALIIGPHETPYEFGFFEVGKSRTTLSSRITTLTQTQFTFKFNKGRSARKRILGFILIQFCHRLSSKVAQCKCGHHQWRSLSIQPKHLRSRPGLPVSDLSILSPNVHLLTQHRSILGYVPSCESTSWYKH